MIRGSSQKNQNVIVQNLRQQNEQPQLWKRNIPQVLEPRNNRLMMRLNKYDHDHFQSLMEEKLLLSRDG